MLLACIGSPMASDDRLETCAHRERVEREFTRQAESFAASPALNAAEIVESLPRALGEARNGRVLDLACGPGIVSEALTRDARQVVAVDLTDRPLRLAALRCGSADPARFAPVRASAESLPVASASLDGAVARLALHHLENPRRALAEVHRVLRPGGVLAVLDLLATEDPTHAELHNALERLRDPSHVEVVTAPALRAAVTDVGLEIVDEKLWTNTRPFDEWARIIADPVRTDALEIVMRHLARNGVRAGIGLREGPAGIEFDYRWALLVARRPGGASR